MPARPDSTPALPETPFELTDYLQLAALGRTSVRFELELENGEPGSVEVVDGAIWNARAAGFRDHQAVAYLLAHPSRRISHVRLEQTPEQRGIHASTQSLLLELAAAQDEQTRDGIDLNEIADYLADIQPPDTDSTPAAGEAPADSRHEQLCRDVIEEVPEAFLCRLLKRSTGDILAQWPREASPHDIAPVLAVLRCGSEDLSGPVNELLISLRSGLRLLKRAPGDRALALSTERGDRASGRGARAGTAWMAVRRAVSALEPSPELKADAIHTELHQLDRDCHSALDQACGRVAIGVTGALGCALFSLKPLRLRGTSHINDPELDTPALRRALELLEQDVDPGRRPLEIAVSADERYYFLAALPAAGWWVALVTDTSERAAVSWVSLRDALPDLVAAVDQSGLAP